MATTKPTRSPRRAQLPAPNPSPLDRPRERSTSGIQGLPLGPYAEKATVYETLHALNRDFEQILAGYEKLRMMGLFRPDDAELFRIMIQETRTGANYDVLEVMHDVEQDDRALFGRLRSRWEKAHQDPLDLRIAARKLKEQIRKEAEKLAKRKRRGAGKKGA